MHENASIAHQPQAKPAALDNMNVPVPELSDLEPGLNQWLPIQLKLSVGAPDDPLEYEADAMADKVMRMPETSFIQRKAGHSCGDYDDEHVRLKPLASQVTPFIQAKSDGAGAVSDAVSDGIKSSMGGGSPMQNNTKSFMESRFGTDFSDVKIHNGGDSAELNTSLNAKAFTVNNNIYFNSGQYQPETDSGRHLLAHELTHVVQQGKGSSNSVQRAIELRRPGRGEASAFERSQEMIDRLNRLSKALHYRLDGNDLLCDVVDESAMTNFDTQMKGFIDLKVMVPLRLVPSTKQVIGDSFMEGYLDLDDLMASDDLAFQSLLLHILAERFSVNRYTQRIGTDGLSPIILAPPYLPPYQPNPVFTRAHGKGHEAQAAHFKEVFNDPSIEYNYEEGKPWGDAYIAFKSTTGHYRIFLIMHHAVKTPTSQVRATTEGTISVMTADGKWHTVEEFLQSRAAAAAPPVQPKLEISQPGNHYEQEADTMAESVMRMPEISFIQRKSGCSCGDYDDEHVRLKPLASQVTPFIQAKGDGSGTVSDAVSSQIKSSMGGGSSMQNDTKSFMESRFGTDFSNVKIHNGGESAELNKSLNAKAFTVNNNIYFNSGQYQPETDNGKHLLAHELTHVVQQQGNKFSIQREPDKKTDGATFHFKVGVKQELNSDQLLLEFIKQYENISDAALSKRNWKWSGNPQKASKTDAKNGYVLIVVQDNFIKPVSAADAKARDEYFKNLPIGQRSAINSATDQQFWNKTKYKEGQKLGNSPDDKLMAKDWLTLRNELIRKKEAIDTLPENIQKFIFDEKDINSLTPDEYDKVLRIASKVANLTQAELNEYKSRVSAKTNDWTVYEASLDRFIQERQEREKTVKEKNEIETRFYGLDDLYKRYKSYTSLLHSSTSLAMSGTPMGVGASLGNQSALNTMRNELEADLKTAGFPGGIADFEKLIHDYEKAFETETLAIAKVMLEQYERVLYLEEAKYQGQASAALYQSVSASKAKENYKKSSDESMSAAMSASPAGGGGPQPWVQAHVDESKRLKKQAETDVVTAAAGHPLVANDDFDLKALADASSESAVRSLMLGYITERRKNITDTKDNLKNKPNMMYGLDALFEASLISQHIKKGSTFYQIIQDRKSEVHWEEAIPKIIQGIVAVAAGLLTGGGGTVAVLAAGTAFGIGAYQALEEFRSYEVKNAAYGAKLTSEDPSMAWVIVAVVAAGIDLTAFAAALPKMRPAIEAFNAGADISDVSKLEKSLALTRVEENITKNIIRAANVEVEARAAWRAILRPPAALRMVIIPLAEEFGRLVFAVYQTVNRGIREFQVFVKTNEAIELIGDISKMSAEDLALFKTGYMKAVGEMETIAKVGKTAGMTDEEVRAFMNLRSSTKGMTADEVLKQMEAWKAAKSTGVPFGFESAEKFKEFQSTAASELKKLLKKTDANAEAFLQGSSVTGISYKRHLPFDATSDMDVAISSRYLFKQADKLGFEVKLSPRRIGPLDADQIAELGLNKLQKRLAEVTEDAGGKVRKVNFMLFDNADAVTKPIGETSQEASRAAIPLKPTKE